MRRLSLIAMLVVLSSSSYAYTHFSKQDCAVNWFNQGVQEGSNGDSMRSLDRMATECPRYGYHINKTQYQAGFKQGQAQRQIREEQLCNNPNNAFALGKENKDYPDICSPDTYPAFKAEYDRGAVIAQEIDATQQSVNDFNDKLANDVRVGHLVQMDSGFYRMSSDDKSPMAQGSVESANELVRQRQPLQDKLFDLQSMP